MTSKRRFKLIAAVVLLVVPPLLAAIAGWLVSPWFLHPVRRELTAQLIGRADSVFQLLHATREDFSVRAPDGVTLYGWKVRPANPNGCWVLLFHGVADNRMGVIGHAEMLLRSGYSVVMMDARAHGASEGAMATYGWLEREDSKSTLDALLVSEREPAIDVQTSAPYPSGDSGKAAPVAHVFSLGESMGAGIALQSAEIDPRIEGVVAEASFATLREASYDYAGLRKSPFLGKTLLAPFSWTLLYRSESLAGFPPSGVSPERSVARRPFPVLIICDENDVALPCRHSKRIYAAATGLKQFWPAPGAYHSAAIGFHPQEFQSRVLTFFAQIRDGSPQAAAATR
jgi:alpha-beta hydrolase superfamily lysophospholipase